MNLFLSALSGCLLILAFPKFNFTIITWIALVPFLVAQYRSDTARSALRGGLTFGLVFFGGIFFWINTLWAYVGPLAILAWVGLTIFQTLFVLLFSYLLWKGQRLRILITALLWVLVVEWLRAWGPFGVTGGDLGYSQYQVLPLIQVASLAGVYGISFLIVLANATLADLWISYREQRKLSWLPVMLLITLIAGTFSYGYYRLATPRLPSTTLGTSRSGQAHDPRLTTPSLKVAIVQANVDQETKLDYRKARSIFDLHERLSRGIISSHPDLIVWPETAVTVFLEHDAGMLSRVRQLARDAKSYLLVGTPTLDRSRRAYNSLLLFSPTGEVIGRYGKEHLVPFGEYLPFRFILGPLFSKMPLMALDYSPEKNNQSLKMGAVKIGPAICFESLFPVLMRERVRRGADFLLVSTNDAWFGNSSAPYQHFAAASLRAVENGVYVIQAANTGISGVVDPTGRIIQQTRVGEEAVLMVEVNKALR